MSLTATPSQTVGPFFHLGFDALTSAKLPATDAGAEAVTIQGRLLDGDGQGVSDGVVEVWLADSQGRYPHPEDRNGAAARFRGFARIPTDASGCFSLMVSKPGAVAGADGRLQAPHLAVTIFARGLLKQLFTRIYFPDEAANESDATLGHVPPERRSTLIARRIAQSQNALEWNVHLQGENETVFFDF